MNERITNDDNETDTNKDKMILPVWEKKKTLTAIALFSRSVRLSTNVQPLDVLR